MVEIFFKVVDTIIELLKLKQQNREQVFKEIIQPLFNDMTLVVHDYFSLFREAEEAVLDASTELRDATPLIRERREELLHARIKIREMADLIRLEFEDEDEQIIDFAHAILRFFYNVQPGELIPAPTKSDSSKLPGSEGFYVVEAFESAQESKLGRPELHTEIRRARTDLEHAWIEVTRAYALLRIRYLGRQRLIRRKTSRPTDQNSGS